MPKKETYLTCENKTVFEGMTSLSAIIRRNEETPQNCRTIDRVLFDISKSVSKKKELDFLKRKSKIHGFSIEQSTAEEIEHFSTGNTHGGIIAFCGDREIPNLEDSLDHIQKNGFYVMLEGIEDPYNFGYAIRSLYAAGVDGIILPPRNWMSVAGIVAKSSAGTSELCNLYSAESEISITMMKNLGYRIIAAGIRNSISMYEADLQKPVFLIVGGEKRGISASVLNCSDEIIRIEYGREFHGSLSAASAATVLSYEVFRQNRHIK